MNLDSLLKIYRDWPHDKLRAEYAKKHDYFAVAVEAMEKVLKERQLLDEAQTSISVSESLQTTITSHGEAKANYTHYSIKSNIDFAEEQKSPDGIYFEKKVMNGAQSMVLGCVGALPIIALVFIIVFVAMDAVEMWINGLLIVFIAITSYWVYYLIKRNKAFIQLLDSGKGHIMRFQLKKEKIKISSPINYRTYTQVVVTYLKGIKVSKPHLYMLFDLPDGRVIQIEEMKNASASMPPDWERLEERYDLLKSDIRLVQHGFTVLHLSDLKRILDGLNQK